MGRLIRGLPIALLAIGAAQASGAGQPITWDGVPAPLRAMLQAHGIAPTAFDPYLERLRQDHARRVREGDLDHLVFYLLQSTHFTERPPIEPALSAKALVDRLSAPERDAFLHGASAPEPSEIDVDVHSRVTALLRALDSSDGDERLAYFRTLVNATLPQRRERHATLLREYLRVMRFLYEKEFVAPRSTRGPEALAELYRARGLSTDTAVEGGYLVYLGLGVVKSLEPDRRVRRALIVGPGLDLAPRTGFVDAASPQSYQPWAVIDALLALGLSSVDNLEVVAADINPRVVEHLRGAQRHSPSLRLVSAIREGDNVTFSSEYVDYFARLGRAAGKIEADAARMNGHLVKTVRIDATAAHALRTDDLDVVTERLNAEPFDIVIATNVLPYFDDLELMLAMSNIAGMLAPGGMLMHNESRPGMADVTTAAGLRFEQSRHAIIATVQGSPPLGDSVWLHRKAR